MTAIHRSALLPYSSRKLYDLVNDVESYPAFMDGCVGAEVLSVDERHMRARLDLSRGGISQSFTTINELTPGERIHLRLAEGPFDSFDGIWQFISLAPEACKVALDLEFKMRGGLLGAAASRLIDGVTTNLVGAIVRRAEVVYGGAHG
ncbi:MAG: type II toxin-antitoxin system RatA family toxin [Halieaceae bacterium]|jgi:ribosome-associated toxin RatA of RatAB toxin-antitoxin module|nr:type II toxin-antitoxin system RatA family toxin [Halieaceae bacterium]